MQATAGGWAPRRMLGATRLLSTRIPGSQLAFTFCRRLALGSVGWVEGPVEVAPEFLLVLGVDQLKDALVHDICLEEKSNT